MPKRKTKRTLKHARGRKKAYRAKRTYKGTTIRKGKYQKKGSKYMTITGANSVPKYVLDRPMDRSHYILKETMVGRATWLPQQIGALGAIQDHGDGFVISMNALANPFGATGIGVTNGGLPTAALPGGGGLYFQSWNTSGATKDIPDGLPAMMLRYTYAYVTHGVMTFNISEDGTASGENTTGTILGSTQVAICSIPASAVLAGSYTTGHVVYPPNSTFGSVGPALDEASFAALCNEPNVKRARLTNPRGSKMIAKIVYPFNMNKIAPPGYWTSSAFFQSQAAPAGNPTYGFQPDILVQFLTDGSIRKDYRIEIQMKWYVTAFERHLVNTI